MKSKKFNVLAIVFYSVIIALALGLPNMAFATQVPDTGQTKCYNNTVEVTCPLPGDPFYGQDASYNINPHSYTDLSNGIVRDNVTGLEWQQTYVGSKTWQMAIDYCNNLSLGGKDDWRLPTVQELSTLVDSSIPSPGPTINTTYFPTEEYYYWSSTPYASGTLSAWIVDFSGGSVYDYTKTYLSYARAVRGGQSNNSFIDNGNGTITDTGTGLIWQKATAPGTYTWGKALAYCENLTLAGYSDWRLPNRNELQSIADYSRFGPAIDTTYFPGSTSSYWSSTTRAGSTDTSSAWHVYFYTGFEGGYTKTNNSLYVRAVSGGQCDDSDLDGVCDNVDNCPTTPNGHELGTCSATSDKPGISCTSDADCANGCSSNGLCIKDQRDANNDGVGDVCDPEYLWAAIQDCKATCQTP